MEHRAAEVRPHPTLFRKLLWGVLPLVVTALFTVGICNYLVARNHISAGIEGEVRTLAEQVAVNVRGFVEQRYRDLETLAESPLIPDYYLNADFGLDQEAEVLRGEIREYFQAFASRTQAHDLVLYFDEEGKLVAGVEEGRILEGDRYEPADHDPPDLESMRGPVPYRSPIEVHGERRRMTLARTLRDVRGAYRGQIVVISNLRSLEDVLDKTRVGRQGRASIQSLDGELLLGRRALGSADLRQRVQVADLPWQVTVEASAEEFLAPLMQLRNLTLFFSVLVAALVIGVLIEVIRRASHPIREMAEGARRLAAGDLDYRVPPPHLRDLQGLAVAFNEMAGNLKERDEQLQSRIRQLTALRTMEGTVLRRLDEQAILRTCLEAVARGLGFDRTGLYWVDEQRGEIAGRYTHLSEVMGFSEQAFRKRRVELGGDDILNRVVRTREAMLVKDPDRASGVNRRFVSESGTREFVLAPLCGKDRVFGVISADNAHSGRVLEPADRDGLMLFASAAGLALENAMLLERVAESEARHRMVLENSPIAILGLSREQRIITWNRGAESIFGCSAAQVVGQPLTALLPAGSEEVFNRLVMEVMEKGAAREFPIKGRTQDGRELDLTVSWGGKEREFWLNDEWAVVIRDVTEAKKLQQQLILSEKLSVAGQLIAGIAHELNNPLQAVVGYAQLLGASENGPAGERRELHHIQDNAGRCRRIIDNLLLFVRQGEVAKRTVNVAEAAAASLELLAHKVRKAARVRIVTQFPEEPLHVRANFQQVEQVFINLIHNACDAMEGWDGAREIRVRVVADEGRVRAEVADTGPGVPAEVRDRLFEPFFTTKGEGRGTGLGLALCRQIMEEHGGTLDLADRDGGGSVFYFELPAVEAEPEAEAGAAEPAPRPAVSGRDILLVEDEASVRALLRDVLEAERHHVHVAASIAEARREAAGRPFDLVVSDVQLDDGTGVDLFEQWAKLSPYPRPGFLFLTGNIVSGPLERVGEEGGAVVLQKPVDLRELRSAVASLHAEGVGE